MGVGTPCCRVDIAIPNFGVGRSRGNVARSTEARSRQEPQTARRRAGRAPLVGAAGGCARTRDRTPGCPGRSPRPGRGPTCPTRTCGCRSTHHGRLRRLDGVPRARWGPVRRPGRDRERRADRGGAGCGRQGHRGGVPRQVRGAERVSQRDGGDPAEPGARTPGTTTSSTAPACGCRPVRRRPGPTSCRRAGSGPPAGSGSCRWTTGGRAELRPAVGRRPGHRSLQRLDRGLRLAPRRGAGGTQEGLSIRVDDTVDRVDGRTGSVSNQWPVRIGSPGVGDDDDQFHGRVDDVFLRIDHPPDRGRPGAGRGPPSRRRAARRRSARSRPGASTSPPVSPRRS